MKCLDRNEQLKLLNLFFPEGNHYRMHNDAANFSSAAKQEGKNEISQISGCLQSLSILLLFC